MSKYIRHNIIRAVRILPEAVRIGASSEEAQKKSFPEDTKNERLLPSDDINSHALEIDKLKLEVTSLQQELKEALSRNRALEEDFLQRKLVLEEEHKKVLVALEEQKEKLFKQAHKEGFQKGQEKGYTEGQSKAQKEVEKEYFHRFSRLVESFNSIHGTLSKERASLAQYHLPCLIRLWEALLSRMLKRSVSIDSQTAVRVLEAILHRISDKEKVVIYLHPCDLDFIEGQKNAYSDLLRGIKILEFHADDHVDAGSCIVETNMGIYDARWRTQLEQINEEIDTLLMEEGSSLDAQPE